MKLDSVWYNKEQAAPEGWGGWSPTKGLQRRGLHQDSYILDKNLLRLFGEREEV